MQQIYRLSHQDAFQMIDAVRQLAETEQSGVAVAVVDAHGELIAFFRSETCPLPSIKIAHNKAYTAARERIATADLGQRAQTEGWAFTNFGDLRYTGWGGGLPIFYRHQLIGAIGVSGLPSDEDIRYVNVALARLKLDEPT
ncbi:heme-binding protein [Anaerolineales bacterium]